MGRTPGLSWTHNENAIFGSEIDGSGRPLVSGFFGRNPYQGLTKASRSLEPCVGLPRSFESSKSFESFASSRSFQSLNSNEGPPPRPFHSLVFVKGKSYRDAGPVEGQRYPFGNPNCFVSMVSVLANEDRRRGMPNALKQARRDAGPV